MRTEVRFRTGQIIPFGTDSRWTDLQPVYYQLVQSCLLDDNSALGYKSAKRTPVSYITGRSPIAHRHGVVRVIKGEESVLAIGADLPNPLSVTYALMYDVLPDACGAFSIRADIRAPGVLYAYEPGTKEHAHEICASLEQIDQDIFCAREGSILHVAICSDAKMDAISELIKRCETNDQRRVKELDAAHA